MAVVFHILCILAALTLESATRILLKGSLQGEKKRLWRRGSDVVSITGKPEQGYFIDIFLGTPPQKLSVVVDTGSSNFAIAGSSTAGVTSFFNSALSTTYSGTPDDKIKVQYFNGTWQGFFARDVFKLCDKCKGGTVDVALITTSSNFFVSPTLWHGILGLGYSALVQPTPKQAETVLDSLKRQGSLSDIFSMTLCGRNNQDTTQLSGSLEFDLPAAEDGFVYTSIVKEWYYQIEITDLTVNGEAISVHCYELNAPAAFIDSGTTNIIFAKTVYYNILAAVESYANTAAKDHVTTSVLKRFLLREQFVCVNSSTTVFSWFPPIVISVARNTTHKFSINVPSQQYVRQTMDSITAQGKISNTTYCYMFGIQEGGSGTILGAAFLERMTVVHDRENGRVGFKVDTNLCNVTDPVFLKTISSLKIREDQGGCLAARKSVLPTIALGLFVALVITTICTLACWASKDVIKSCTAEVSLRYRRTQNYSYMLNSEEDDSSLQLELEEGDTVGNGVATKGTAECDDVVIENRSVGSVEDTPVLQLDPIKESETESRVSEKEETDCLNPDSSKNGQIDSISAATVLEDEMNDRLESESSNKVDNTGSCLDTTRGASSLDSAEPDDLVEKANLTESFNHPDPDHSEPDHSKYPDHAHYINLPDSLHNDLGSPDKSDETINEYDYDSASVNSLELNESYVIAALEESLAGIDTGSDQYTEHEEE